MECAIFHHVPVHLKLRELLELKDWTSTKIEAKQFFVVFPWNIEFDAKMTDCLSKMLISTWR